MKNLTISFNKVLLAHIIALLATITAYCQNNPNTLSGKVSDEMGNSLSGATILIEGTKIGVVSDVEGNFLLSLPKEINEGKINVSYVGYLSESFDFSGSAVINVTLVPSLQSLNEVVVVGYGVQKKSDLTGAIASVSGESLTNTMTLRVDQALQGKAAGVQIVSNTGMPSSDVTIKIRGTSSISSDNTSPIVIIDGLPGNLNNINPNDIESIEVLKDASSQAIYGASGGNGVILITTKRGKSGNIQTDFNFYRGMQSPWKTMDVMNAKEFAGFYNKNVSQPRNGKDYFTDLNNLPEVNWQNEIFRKALMEDYNFRISGGSDLSTFMFSAGYGNMEGVVKDTYLKRFNFRINSDHQITKRVKFGESIAVDTRTFKDMFDNNDYGGYVTQAVTAIPASTIKDENGLFYVSSLGGFNPVGRMYYSHNKQRQSNLNANSFLKIDIIKNLVYEMRLGGSFGLSEGFAFEPTYTTSDPKWVNTRSSITNSYYRSYGWNFQNVLSYNFTVLKSLNLGLMAGTEASSGTSDDIRGTRYDLWLEDEHWQVLDGSINEEEQLVTGNKNQYRNNAVFGRLNLNYFDKYLVSASIRQDGSYKFGPEYRKGIFPSISIGWKFSDEKFFRNLEALNFGKLRFGWGETGNSNIDPFSFIPLIQSVYTDGYFFKDTYYVGAARSKPANNNLHWEAMVSTNLGLDLTFLNNRFSASVDVFEKHNNGMLVQQNLPGYVGRFATNAGNEGGDTRPVVNIGKISNKGIEFTFGYKKSQGDLNYNLDFNLTAIKTKILDITDPMIDGKYFGGALNNLTLSEEGNAPYLFYGYVTDGIFTCDDDTATINGKLVVRNQPYRIENGKVVYLQQNAQPGDLRFVDTNNDTVLSASDMKVIGNPNPKFTFGFTGNIAYKIFDLSFAIQGSYGNDIFNALKLLTYNNTGSSNWVTDRNNSYRMPTETDPGNTNTTLFRVDPRNTNNNLRQSDWYVEDGSYVRLKSLQIGVSLPESVISRLKIQKCRVFIGGNNLITLTKYSGMDPEIGPVSRLATGIDLGVYPQSRVYMLGANVTF
jgi:TonB-dependent starch-binding outer membrane protein SusC